MAALARTVPLRDVSQADFDTVFYPGGHGPLWDLAEDADSIRLIEQAFSAGKPVAAVCHGPAVFRHTRGALGEPLVKDKRVTAFSDEEEEAVGLAGVVPFSLEDALKKNGAHYERGPVWQSYVVTDGKLVTGQNPASSEAAAEDVLRLLR